jgi:hypothetical protein
MAWAGGPRDHERGFFLRIDLGGGYAETTNEMGPLPKLEYSDGTFAGDLSFGAVVKSNLAVHGTWFGWRSYSPFVIEVLGVELDPVTLSAWGGGLTYYFMPINIYLSANAGAGKLSGFADGSDIDSDWGLALNLSAGKEWWVKDALGVGVAVAFGYHSISDPDVNDDVSAAKIRDDWTGTHWSIFLTMTRN